MKKRLCVWQTSGGLFNAVFGMTLQFTFELCNFWKPVVIIAAINESTWKHLKMVFWQGFFPIFSSKIFLFEHIDLMNTGVYGILDNYEDLMVVPW
jgi:hypothetical protein